MLSLPRPRSCPRRCCRRTPRGRRSSCPTRAPDSPGRRRRCPTRCWRHPPSVPQTMLSHAESAQAGAPHGAARAPRPRRCRLRPDGVAPGSRAHGAPDDALAVVVVDAPQGTSVRHAFASGCSTPPPMRWLPQMMCRLHARRMPATVARRAVERSPPSRLRELHGAARVQEAGALRQRVVGRARAPPCTGGSPSPGSASAPGSPAASARSCRRRPAPPCSCRSGSGTAA